MASGKDDSHWDLLLELDSGRLLTWRIAQLPFLNLGGSAGIDIARFAPTKADAAICIPAIRLPDHRAVYLDYEGPINNDRGYVARRAGGHYLACLVDLPSNDQALPNYQLLSDERVKPSDQCLPAELPSQSTLQVKLKSPELIAEFRIALTHIAETATLHIVP